MLETLADLPVLVIWAPVQHLMRFVRKGKKHP